MNYRDLVEKLSAIELGEDDAVTTAPDNLKAKSGEATTATSEPTTEPAKNTTATIPGQQPDIGHGSKMPPGAPITPQGTAPTAPVNPNNNNQTNDIKNQITAMQNALMALRIPQTNATAPTMQPTTTKSVDQQAAIAAQKAATLSTQAKPGEPILEADTDAAEAERKRRERTEKLVKLANKDPQELFKGEIWYGMSPAQKLEVLKHPNINADAVRYYAAERKLESLPKDSPERTRYKKESDDAYGKWSAWRTEQLKSEGKPEGGDAEAEKRRKAEAEKAEAEKAEAEKAEAEKKRKAEAEKAEAEKAEAEKKRRQSSDTPAAEEDPNNKKEPRKFADHVTAGYGMGSKTKPNDAVRKMQQQLIDAGYELPKFGADGIFRDETRRALAKFQADNNLKDQKGRAAGKETNPALAAAVEKKKRESEAPPASVETDEEKAKAAEAKAKREEQARQATLKARRDASAHLSGVQWGDDVDPDIPFSKDHPAFKNAVALKKVDGKTVAVDKDGKVLGSYDGEGSWKATPAVQPSTSDGPATQVAQGAELSKDDATIKAFLDAHPGVTYNKANGQFKDEKGQHLGSFHDGGGEWGGNRIDISGRKDFKTSVPGVYTGSTPAAAVAPPADATVVQPPADATVQSRSASSTPAWKATHSVPNRITRGSTELMQRDGKFYDKDGKEWEKPWLSRDPSPIPPPSGTSPDTQQRQPPGAKAPDKVSATTISPEEGDQMVRYSTQAESIVRLDSVVDELLNEDWKSDVWDWTKDAAQTSDDWARGTANYMTGDFADKATAKVNSWLPGGKDYETELSAEKARSAAAQKRSPRAYNAIRNTVADPLQTADDAVRSGANTLFLGLPDRLEAGANTAWNKAKGSKRTWSDEFDDQLTTSWTNSSQAEKRSPAASGIADMAGNVGGVATGAGAATVTGALLKNAPKIVKYGVGVPATVATAMAGDELTGKAAYAVKPDYHTAKYADAPPADSSKAPIKKSNEELSRISQLAGLRK